MPQGRGLGRRFSSRPRPRRLLSSILPATVTRVERVLNLPTQYVLAYDQGAEGACVGFSCSWMMSILNRRLYDARQLYREAQQVDEWPETPPEEGTSVWAGCEILRTKGHWRLFRGLSRIANPFDGIDSVRWATRVDELRTAIYNGVPFVLGINWYQNFWSPVYHDHVPNDAVKGEWWIGKASHWGRNEGGHAICGYAASDARQAFRLVNTWGYDYPRVWIGYNAVQRLLDENGEAALVTDRIEI